MKKVTEKALTRIFIQSGYASHCAFLLSGEISEDLFENRQNSLREKIWAYRRGFLSSDIDDYGLTETNYRQFLSNRDYYRLYPLNGLFDKWIDDKVTTKYILQPFNSYMPRYYCLIADKDLIMPLMDSDGNSPATAEAIVDLLMSENNLALKLVYSQSGIGFHKISYTDDGFSINNNIVDRTKMLQFIEGLEGYIVTEYIRSHHEISRIYSVSPNTARVMVVNEDGRHPVIANAFMRFGTARSGVVDNVTGGGIAAIVDVETGRFHDALKIEDHHTVKCVLHPDTHLKIEGILPHWELIKTKLIEISRYLSELRFMGYDIVITEEGFKILEINSLQTVARFQNNYPLRVNNAASSFFNKLLKENRG